MIEIFEELAQVYDDWFNLHEDTYKSELGAVQALLPPGQGLEIGVGTGRFAGPLGLKFGVEPAQAMAALAQIRGIQVIRGYAETLPIAGASFDFALMVTVLCFLADPLLALAEAVRVVKPSGWLIIGLIDPESPLGRSYEANRAQSRFFRQAIFHRVPQVQGWLEELGCPTLARRQTVFQAPSVPGGGPESVQAGFGAGSFVVLAAQRLSR